jgi:feruloyl-CoA synthase
MVAHQVVRETLATGLRRYNATARGSSMKVTRALFLTEPPSIDSNEITDKGYINQRAVLERRAALLDRLYAAVPDPDVIVL